LSRPVLEHAASLQAEPRKKAALCLLKNRVARGKSASEILQLLRVILSQGRTSFSRKPRWKALYRDGL
jgi:hypothetical protein